MVLRPALTLAALLAALSLPGCGGGGDADPSDARPPGPDAAAGADASVDAATSSTSASIGPAGGTLAIAGVTVTVPPGALAEATTLTLTVGGTPGVAPPAGLSPLTPLITLLPHGQTFTAPVTVQAPVIATPGPTTTVWYLADDADPSWDFLAAATVSGTTLTFETTHFSVKLPGSSGEDCDDQIDNDGDQLADCRDPLCRGIAGCPLASNETDCADGRNEDGDNATDCQDSDCTAMCGTLDVPFAITLNGAASTCAAVSGMVATYDLAGPGPYDRNNMVTCVGAGGTISFGTLPAGAYVLNASLLGGNNVTLTSVGPTPINVVGGMATQAAQTFAVTRTCPAVQISRVYLSGGFDAAGFRHDFVELHNRTSAPVSLAGHGLHVLPQAGAAWHVTNLSALTIPANGFVLVRYAGGSIGQAVPVDVEGPAPLPDLDGNSTSIVLAPTTTPYPDGVCPAANYLDKFGTMGVGTDCAEGGGFAGGPDASMILARTGCVDTDSNVPDFTLQPITPPRHTGSPGVVCPPCQ